MPEAKTQRFGRYYLIDPKTMISIVPTFHTARGIRFTILLVEETEGMCQDLGVESPAQEFIDDQINP